MRKNFKNCSIIFLSIWFCFQCEYKAPFASVSEKFNGSFELNQSSLNQWENVVGWNGNEGGVSDDGYFAPVDGKYYAVQSGGGNWITQKENLILEKGKSYHLSAWVRSINGKKNDARTTAEIEFIVDKKPILKKFVRLNQTENEKVKKLEQLRALENGINIHVTYAKTIPIGVDTKEDYVELKNLMEYKK